MKIVLLSSSSDAVGVSVHIFELAKLLSENDMLDTVLCPNTGWLPDKLAIENIPFQILNISYKWSAYIPSSLNLYRFLKSKSKGTIIHLHGRFPLFISVYSLLFRRDLGFVVTIHQFINAGVPGRFCWKVRLETYLLRFMRGICCVSHDLQNEILKRVVGEQRKAVTTIPNWIRLQCYSDKDRDQNMFRNRFNRRENFSMCAIGRLVHEKGFDVLINSVSILVKAGINIKCDIFGDGPDRVYLADLVRALDLKENIFFMGNVSDVRLQLLNYSVMVVPSRTESFGLVVLEAYDASVLVIASNIPGLKSIVLHGETGILFEVGNPESLAGAIKEVFQRRVDVDSLIINAHKVLQDYTPNYELLNKYETFYRKAL